MIRLAEPWLPGNERLYVLQALDNRQLSAGPFVSRFEAAFAEQMGARYGVATSSGTTALHLILAALGVGPGDEVIVPALTFVATANAVRYTGAEVVLADVTPLTWCLTAQEALHRITPRTKAIVAVHLYGHPADMTMLRKLCEAKGLYLIEDAAEAPGATCDGLPVGSLGRAAAFSFYGNKIITTGEGGMVTTNDAALAERLRLLRGQGQDPARRYWHTVLGFNYRMAELQGAVGLGQTEEFPNHLAARRRIARQYRMFGPNFEWQVDANWAKPAYWMNALLLPAGLERHKVMHQLAERGIETRPAFYPLAVMPPYAYLAPHGPWPVAEDIARRGLCLPTHAGLTSDDVATVCAALTTIYTERGYA